MNAPMLIIPQWAERKQARPFSGVHHWSRSKDVTQPFAHHRFVAGVPDLVAGIGHDCGIGYFGIPPGTRNRRNRFSATRGYSTGDNTARHERCRNRTGNTESAFCHGKPDYAPAVPPVYPAFAAALSVYPGVQLSS